MYDLQLLCISNPNGRKDGRKHLRICSHGIELHVLKKIAMNTDQTLKKISTRKRERDHHLAAALALNHGIV
jgi:hypothetical protein